MLMLKLADSSPLGIERLVVDKDARDGAAAVDSEGLEVVGGRAYRE